ncbi:hypothetical protein [Sphingomonas quercus]|uniref:hypothetical protein n=1 Tax=Sphingomonas quercus TaxID=2842451 RepID=UPI00209B0A69|nr:hypothetical protein [Sphingomonas quercus]
MIGQIRAVDPSYGFESLGFPTTLQGQINQVNALRFDRAVVLMRKEGELQPMQTETLRFMQESADIAYKEGLRQLQAGKLNVRLSEQEALGNFIDREVRRDCGAAYATMALMRREATWCA